MTRNEDAPAGQGERADHQRSEPLMAAPHHTAAEQFRQFADLLEQHPDLRAPAHIACCDIVPTYDMALAKTQRLGGVWHVEQDPDGYPILSRRIGPVDYRILVESVRGVRSLVKAA